MGMTGAGESHTIEITVDGPKTEQQTKDMMRAVRELLKSYGARVGRQIVCVKDKAREPDPKP